MPAAYETTMNEKERIPYSMCIRIIFVKPNREYYPSTMWFLWQMDHSSPVAYAFPLFIWSWLLLAFFLLVI